ncbi:MAG: PD-(D/E)XK motif protein [Clostridium sp.]|uniref:PD-(D/E)XK motif protein n=1 Tax=Clostridium sp. TaxID=1506 RepID=UPI0029104DE3|nr:PD-(D/E)XK motif protein [Clostridium sp.]MDU5110578.1 PD-(D/E)XK motif protein [Clostridium sp.]
MIIMDKFESEKVTRTYRRVDENHPLDIYLGYSEDNFPSMSIYLYGRPIKVNSSNAIQVELKKKNETSINLTFKLLDKDKVTIFYKFCEDIIESTRNAKCSSYLAYIIARWNKWRSMFKRQNAELLTENQVVGLIGELLFLRDYMITTYGKSDAIMSWGGPSKSHKDYEIKDTWYEIKTVRQGASKVKISSIEQLDSNVEGSLVLYLLEATNENVEGAISLNPLINQLFTIFEEFEMMSLFQSKLIEAGYSCEEEYDNYNYRFIRRDIYTVKDGFPRILEKDLIEGVVGVSYDISLVNIKKFLRVN